MGNRKDDVNIGVLEGTHRGARRAAMPDPARAAGRVDISPVRFAAGSRGGGGGAAPPPPPGRGPPPPSQLSFAASFTAMSSFPEPSGPANMRDGGSLPEEMRLSRSDSTLPWACAIASAAARISIALTS
jgi:hypothetical protein